ncbi:hypothetical protein [Streptomyces sp. CA-106110]
MMLSTAPVTSGFDSTWAKLMIVSLSCRFHDSVAALFPPRDIQAQPPSG